MISIRLCRLDEGARIARFLQDVGDPGVEAHGIPMEWGVPVTNWLLAEDDDEIVGALAYAVCRPIGIVESLAIDPKFGKIRRTRIASRLVRSVCAILQRLGCSALIAFIPDAHDYWRKTLASQGMKVAYRGEMMIYGLRQEREDCDG